MKVISADELILIRDFIQDCRDESTDAYDKRVVLVVHNCWQKCHQNWIANTPVGEEDRNIVDPSLAFTRPLRSESTAMILSPKPIDFSNLSKDDRRLLRSLRITIDEQENDGNK
jgi:hypothetical protein